MKPRTLNSRKAVAAEISAMLASISLAQASAPVPAPAANDVRALNPQPLPPKENVRVNSGTLNALNPQPLPPKERATIDVQTLQDIKTLSPDTPIRVRGVSTTVSAFRGSMSATVVHADRKVSAPVVLSSPDYENPTIDTSIKDPARDYINRTLADTGGSRGRGLAAPPPIKWVTHDVSNTRWRNVSCDGVKVTCGLQVNHCDGGDASTATSDRDIVSTFLKYKINGVGGTGAFCQWTGNNPGAFHTRYDDTSFQKNSGVDVYEINFNPNCRIQSQWIATNAGVSFNYTDLSIGSARMAARWTTQSCFSAALKSGSIVWDEDYACVASYYIGSTQLKCPEGIRP